MRERQRDLETQWLPRLCVCPAPVLHGGDGEIRAKPLLGDLRPALIPIADSIIDTEYIFRREFSPAAPLIWLDGSERQDFGFSHNALERKRAHRRRSAVEILI
jgi:hypothetical protein